MSGIIFGNRILCITFMCAVMCFDWSTQAKVKIQVPDATIKDLREEAKTCEAETGIPANYLKKIMEGPYPDDEASLKFMHCMTFNHGYSDKDGHAIIEKLGALPVSEGTQEDYKNILVECNKITKGNYLETLNAVGNCIRESAQYLSS